MKLFQATKVKNRGIRKKSLPYNSYKRNKSMWICLMIPIKKPLLKLRDVAFPAL